MSAIAREMRLSDVQSRLKDALPIVQEEAATAERLRRPTPVTQKALRESGVFSLTVPAELGGADASPLQVIETIEDVSYADASIGWLVIALHTETARAAVELNDTAVEELFRHGDHPLIAGQAAPIGRAVESAEGLRVSGSWRFAAGLPLASHVRTSVEIEGHAQPVVVLLPRAALDVTDNWDVLGLRATAGLDFSCDDILVEARYVTDGQVRRGSATHRLSPAMLAGLNQGAWALGVGRRMLDELAERTRRRACGPGTVEISDELFGELARHEARLRGARALLLEVWRENEQTLAVRPELTQQQITSSHLADSAAVRTAREIGQLVHRFAGPAVIRDGLLQRFFRDIHAGTQHRGSSTDVTQNCGRMLSGVLPEGAKWAGFNIEVP
jgi:indole-3-acetate monooxygenase